MGSVFVNGIEQDPAGQNGGFGRGLSDLGLIHDDVRLLDEDDDSYVGERRVFDGRWFERNRSCWHIADERKMRREFADGWRDIGRPFFECAYCGGKHFRPEVPGTPCCGDERFVRGVIYSFPSLHRSAPGLCPWKPEKWARWWRTSGALTGGSRHAVAFVLSLWAGGNSDYWRRRGFSFDAVAAFGSWDDAHREAFMRWCRNPWRP